jgi:DNA-binding transcriptional LysR family regulator
MSQESPVDSEHANPLTFPIAINAITLRQLQYFVAVAEDEHFTRASERLLIAQPSLSRQIRDLEETLGVSLFVRGSRGVYLTDAGRDLFVHVRQILAMLERAFDSVRETAQGGRGSLRLGYYGPTFFNNPVTHSALEHFRAEWPDIEVVGLELFTGQMVDALRAGRIDVAICRGEPGSSDLHWWTIATERLYVLLSATDPLAAAENVALGDLDGRKLITFPQALSLGLNARVAEVAALAGVSLPPAREVTQLASIAYHVSVGDGIAILPASSSVLSGFQNVVSRELRDPNATCDITVWAREGETDRYARAFLEMLGVPK